MVLDKYRLELHWERFTHVGVDSIEVQGPVFKGPALKEAAYIKGGDHIVLDVSKQFYSVAGGWATVALHWGEVTKRLPGAVYFGDAYMQSPVFSWIVPYLPADSFLVIDTSKHEEDTHNFNLYYEAFFVNRFGIRYKVGT